LLSSPSLAQGAIKNSLAGGIILLQIYKRVPGIKSLLKGGELIDREGAVENHLPFFPRPFDQK
jgi:hypothetical protein